MQGSGGCDSVLGRNCQAVTHPRFWHTRGNVQVKADPFLGVLATEIAPP